jgi:hypothetical protein
MSDSLNATVIVSVCVLTISANEEADELALDELEPPRLPALEPVELEDELPELSDVEAVEPADTESPGTNPCKDTIVPLIGA